MHLRSLTILNYKNIREATLTFADKINCFVGLNGQGKTNLLDAIYYLSFTKSAFSPIDSQNITHGQDMAMIQGEYIPSSAMPSPVSPERLKITCGIRRGQKKQFRRDATDYKRLLDHIGLIPLVMISPQDNYLIEDGSDERRRFMDVVISQFDRLYLEHLTQYNQLLKQRNTLLKQYEDRPDQLPDDLLDVLEMQLDEHAQYIFSARSSYMEQFVPIFHDIYACISGQCEQVSLRYVSQLQNRNLIESFRRTRSRDLILGWTSQGIHKDDLELLLDSYPLKRVGSQGQQKSFLLALKLAQAVSLGKPILLLDDIFDKLDAERMERIIALLATDRFGQIFITDTDRQNLTDILASFENASQIFLLTNGQVSSPSLPL